MYLKFAHDDRTWHADHRPEHGSLRTMADDGHGKLTGAGVTNTKVNYATGEAWFTPAVLPAVSTHTSASTPRRL